MARILKYKFLDTVKIYNIGDVHRGNKNCDVKFLKKIVKDIDKSPNTYWVSTGDLLEVATKHSKSSPYTSVSLEEELQLLSNELRPISQKCLGFTTSNHHKRVEKETGLSLDATLARELQIPFLGITGIIRVVVDKGAYFCVLHHGVGGGTAGNKLNRARKLARNVQGADVYFTGHTHTYTHFPFLQQGIDRKRNKPTEFLSHMVVTGHCLSWKGSYAEEYGLEPSPIGLSRTTLHSCACGNERNKKVTSEFVTP